MNSLNVEKRVSYVKTLTTIGKWKENFSGKKN
jgi:hypothetical protein